MRPPCRWLLRCTSVGLFLVHETASTGIYPLSLHDALPIFIRPPIAARSSPIPAAAPASASMLVVGVPPAARSEEHTSELQSPDHLVCRLLLEKKNEELVQVHRLDDVTVDTQMITVNQVALL